MPRGERRTAMEPQQGFTLVAMIAALAVVSVGLAVAGPAEGDRLRREKERELMRIGTLYADAIARYRDLSPGGQRTYPPTLDALLLDQRFVGIERHLRSLYGDPLDPARPWGLLRDNSGNVMGVYSQAQDAPIAQGPVRAGDVALAAARHYADWKFLAPITP